MRTNILRAKARHLLLLAEGEADEVAGVLRAAAERLERQAMGLEAYQAGPPAIAPHILRTRI